MRRCFVFFLPLLLIGAVAHTQLVNNGATITVQSGATIKCTGSIINNSGGIIQNAGIVSSDGEFRNETGGTLANNVTVGTYEATTKFVNNGNAFTGINLKLIGNVNTDSVKSGTSSTYANVNLTKGAGNTATLSDAMTVTGAFTFDNDDNRLILADKNLIMGPSATFVSADANEFVVTNSTGTVTKQNLGSTSFTYEVGFAAGQYNPLSIANTGTTDNISVRCLQNVLDQGLTGAPVTSHFANNSWVVTEAVAGGSNLQLIAGWSASDELASFNRIKAGVARYNTGTDWDLPASNVIAASGSGPYTLNRSNILSTGVFAVADLAQVNAARLNLKVFLQGAYNGTTMNDGLRTHNVIPITQPYSSAMNAIFTRVGVYDGSATVNETVPATTVFDVAGTNDDIVDWVYLSLQDGTTPATKLQTRAALIQRDGDIVEYDAVSGTYGPVKMPIDADGNYHLVVSHRNHLSIRTSVAPLLQDNVTTSYNFTTAQAQAFQNGAITANAAMRDLGSGVFGLWAGNANSNTTVRASGPASLNDYTYLVNVVLLGNTATILNNVYNSADMNMDGAVRASGPASLNDYTFLVNVILLGNTATIFTQH
jgi:hypothetical protein